MGPQSDLLFQLCRCHCWRTCAFCLSPSLSPCSFFFLICPFFVCHYFLLFQVLHFFSSNLSAGFFSWWFFFSFVFQAFLGCCYLVSVFPLSYLLLIHSQFSLPVPPIHVCPPLLRMFFFFFKERNVKLKLNLAELQSCRRWRKHQS